MCGIAGFSFEDKALVKRMTDSISHRGPDDSGFYTDENVSLGHRRLSIIDLSRKGRQPMSNEEGTIWITFNGEVYNYKEIKAGLKGNHEFSSNTDTEVLVHAYEEYGLEFLKKLRGMFAFCLYDSEKGLLILARDNIGKKPLYYHYDGENIIFGSEIKAIHEAGVEKGVDQSGLLSYLGFMYTAGPQTIFSGVKKVMGGHFLVFDLKTRGIEVKQYWDVKEDIEEGEDASFVKKLSGLLEESATLRLRSDVPVGAFLSGGIDSSIAVAYARDKVDYDFHTFSMGFEGHSELDHARRVSEYLDTKHHEIMVRENDVLKHFEKVAWHFDEPVGDAATVANYFLSMEARKHVKVVLAGEAGDELFAGYGNYKDNLRYHTQMPVPGFGKAALSGALKAVPGSVSGNPWNNRNFRRLQYASLRDLKQIHMVTTMGLSVQEIKWLLKGGLKGDVFSGVVDPPEMKEPLNYMLALDLKNLLPEKFLMKADKATMAHGLEERLVIMDRDIAEYSYRIPTRLKIRENRGKWVLRKAGEKRLKGISDILWRKKMGFGVPIDRWMGSVMKDVVLQKLEGEFLGSIMEKNALEKVAGSVTRKGFTNYHQAVVAWGLFALEVWHEQFFG